MAKQKESKPDEFFRSQIRSLKKENNYLRKRVRQLENLINEDIIEEVREVKKKANICKECARGQLSELEIVGRVFEVCNVCDFRRKIKALKRK